MESLQRQSLKFVPFFLFPFIAIFAGVQSGLPVTQATFLAAALFLTISVLLLIAVDSVEGCCVTFCCLAMAFAMLAALILTHSPLEPPTVNEYLSYLLLLISGWCTLAVAKMSEKFAAETPFYSRFFLYVIPPGLMFGLMVWMAFPERPIMYVPVVAGMLLGVIAPSLVASNIQQRTPE